MHSLQLPGVLDLKGVHRFRVGAVEDLQRGAEVQQLHLLREVLLLLDLLLLELGHVELHCLHTMVGV